MKKETDNVKNYVGIDVGKRSLEIVRINELNKIQRMRCEAKKIDYLLSWLKPSDIVGLEAGNQAFRIAKAIKKRGIEVIVLNPGDLATIYNSLKKTDKEDALKLARLIQRIPKEELPTVMIPTDEEEDNRRLTTHQGFLSEQLSNFKNRLQSLFTAAGILTVKRKDLSSEKNRELVLKELPTRYESEARRLNHLINEIEKQLEEAEKEITEKLKKDIAYTGIVMSVPGVAKITAFAITSYLGNIERFSNAKQVSYYVGLVPRLDISGDTKRFGHIVKRGCTPIRRCIVQGAWALVRSDYGGPIKSFYEKKKGEIGKRKAIVAVARKMIETIYAMLRTSSLYQDVPEEVWIKKLRYYKLID